MTLTLPIKVLPEGTYPTIAPTRAHTGDAALDCYAAARRWIEPGEITTIPLGFATAIPEGHAGLLTLRSSVGANGLALTNGTGIIDSGYRGEVKAAVTTWDDTPYLVEAGARIVQLTIVPILMPTIELVDSLPDTADGRGTNGFGSTGK